MTQAWTGPVRPPARRSGVALLTTVQGQVPGGCGGSVEYGPVQKVDGGLCVDYLEHLAEQETQLLRCRLDGSDYRLRCGERRRFAMILPLYGSTILPTVWTPEMTRYCEKRLSLTIWTSRCRIVIMGEGTR